MFTAITLLFLLFVVPSLYGWWLSRKNSQQLDKIRVAVDDSRAMRGVFFGNPPSSVDSVSIVGLEELANHLDSLSQETRNTDKELSVVQRLPSDAGFQIPTEIYSFPGVRSAWRAMHGNGKELPIDQEIELAFEDIIQ